MTEKYVHGYKWKGRLRVDGGWGIKNKVQDIYEKQPTNEFSLTPDATISNLPQAFGYPSGDTLTTADASGDLKSTIETDHYYDITVNGNKIDQFIQYLQELRRYAGQNMNVELYNENDNQYNQPLYQLNISLGLATDEIPVFMLYTGKWKPSFDNKTLTAGW